MTHKGLNTLRKILPNTPARRRLVIDLCDELATFGHLCHDTVEKELTSRGVILPENSHAREEILEQIRDFIMSI